MNMFEIAFLFDDLKWCDFDAQTIRRKIYVRVQPLHDLEKRQQLFSTGNVFHIFFISVAKTGNALIFLRRNREHCCCFIVQVDGVHLIKTDGFKKFNYHIHRDTLSRPMLNILACVSKIRG